MLLTIVGLLLLKASTAMNLKLSPCGTGHLCPSLLPNSFTFSLPANLWMDELS